MVLGQVGILIKANTPDTVDNSVLDFGIEGYFLQAGHTQPQIIEIFLSQILDLLKVLDQ